MVCLLAAYGGYILYLYIENQDVCSNWASRFALKGRNMKEKLIKVLKEIKKFIKSLMLVLAFFSAAWFLWREMKYIPLTRNMTVDEAGYWGELLMQQYSYKDSEGYTYTLHVPGYLNISGIIYISYGGGPEFKLLIIKPYIFGNRYSVVLGQQNGIEADVDKTGRIMGRSYDEQSSESFKAEVKPLFDKVKAFWPSLIK